MKGRCRHERIFPERQPINTCKQPRRVTWQQNSGQSHERIIRTDKDDDNPHSIRHQRIRARGNQPRCMHSQVCSPVGATGDCCAADCVYISAIARLEGSWFRFIRHSDSSCACADHQTPGSHPGSADCVAFRAAAASNIRTSWAIFHGDTAPARCCSRPLQRSRGSALSAPLRDLHHPRPAGWPLQLHHAGRNSGLVT